MAQGKASPGDSGKRPPKTSTRGQGSTRAPNGNGTGGKNDEMEGLFVDPAPDSKRSARAADRRRERGQAPQPAGQPDTRASLQRKEEQDSRASARNGSQMSALNPQSFAKAHLQCTRGPEEGLSLNLIEGNYTIGRARENSFVLKDIAASRRHLRIDVDGRGARVVDLGSGNGTRVNGKRIAEHELRNGDRIEIGGSVLQFVEKGAANGAGAGDGVDDAQERVIRAAEKLAAELSQRMRFEQEGNNGSRSGFEDGHVAKTQALPKAAKDKLTDEIKRQQQQAQQNAANGQQPPQKAEKLWKETFTNLPLNQVVAADQPLRGPRAAEAVMPPSTPAAVNNNTRNPLPRPAPLPMPPMPDDVDMSGSASRGGGSFVMSLLVTTLVVVLGGGLVITFYALTRNRGGDEMTAVAAQEEYDRAMQKCLEAYSAGEWLRSYEYATLALQLQPNDVMARRYQADSRERIDAATRGGAAPSPTGPSLTPANGPSVNGANGTAVDANPANANPANANPPQNTAQPPAPANGTTGTTAPSPPAPVGVVAAPAPPKQTAAPAPAPAREVKPKAPSPPKEAKPKAPKAPSTRAQMTDATAQGKFSDAVDALRDKDAKKGCKLLEEIADKAPPDSRWKEKAENLYSRRCD